MMTGIESKVSDILKEKGTKVYTIQKTASVYEAIEEMTGEGVGSLVVMDGEEISGIVTERDYLRKVIVKGRSSRETPVSDIMSSNVICTDPGETVKSCMAVMTEKRIRHLPVLENARLAGLVSIGDLIKQVARDRKATIKYLKDYISGRYPA
jgi:CBS domain-containing protein